MQKFIDNAYEKIQTIYSNPKGKNFIIHLTRAFLPIDMFSFYVSTDKHCAITGKRGLNIDELIELTKDNIILQAKTMAGNDKEKKEAELKLLEIHTRVREYFKVEVGEDIRETRKIYFSEKSDKYLSLPALIALRNFAMDNILRDRAISYAMCDLRLKESRKFTDDESKIIAKVNSGFSLKLGEVEAFKELQKKFNKDKL